MQKYFILPALLVLFLMSCNTGTFVSPAEVATSCEISFLGDLPNELIIVDNEKDLNTLKNMFSGGEAPQENCPLDGHYTMYKSGKVVVEGDFDLGEKCKMVSWMQDGKLETAGLTEEAFVLLSDIKKKLEEKYRPANLNSLEWFLEKWRIEEENGTLSYEVWKKVNDNLYTASVYNVNGKDTTMLETLELKSDDSGVYYIPNVSHNNGPVPFKLITLADSVATFRNPEHDFPQTIAYAVRNDSLVATISGMYEGKFSERKFRMKKEN